jgi:hypothetical protein
LSDFIITLPLPAGPGDPSISAAVVINGSLFEVGARFTAGLASSLNIPVPITIPKNKKITIKDVPVVLSLDAIGGLNSTFGLTLPTGTQLGTADISVTVAKKPL